MYDDIINNVAYSLADDGITSEFLSLIFAYCGHHAIDFFGFFGVMLGVKFLKDSFH